MTYEILNPHSTLFCTLTMAQRSRIVPFNNMLMSMLKFVGQNS
jgi:hypothetical protein